MDENGDSQETEVERAREEVIEAMATTAEMYGTKRSLGRLYGILYFADGPLSLDDLAERSDYAKSTVSSAMSTLERYYLVKRRSLPGEGKRAFFEAEREWWDVMKRLLETEGQREIVTMNRALDTAQQRLEAATAPTRNMTSPGCHSSRSTTAR
ncbi:GbsR/MarR family transcriptional regulator [Halovenus salina]|uniref:HTH-type transcriptional regulator n=1 Tax=Halovenus salina TaxID=1510225 RepID=A0ABD5W2L3_9EURY